jgi:hypothetical protein
MGDITADAIDRAAQLALNDAAYALWSQKYQLDREEASPPKAPKRPTNLSDPEEFGRAVRDAIAKITADRANAHDGTTFHRLKAAHPQAADQDLQNAIKAAVRFDTDCTRFFSYSEAGLLEDARRAVEQARLKNPDFAEVTYRLARLGLCEAMR